MTGPSTYGRLGLDVGQVGRWFRLVYGGLFLAVIFTLLLRGFGGMPPLDFWVRTAVAFVGVLVAYSAVYYVLAIRVLARGNAWLNTAIFVGPALVIFDWNFTAGALTHLSLPGYFLLAMGLYGALSFLVQWKIRYGGCELVVVPILLFKRRYVTYCLPLVAADATEKKVVSSQRVLWRVLLGVLVGLFTFMFASIMLL